MDTLEPVTSYYCWGRSHGRPAGARTCETAMNAHPQEAVVHDLAAPAAATNRVNGVGMTR